MRSGAKADWHVAKGTVTDSEVLEVGDHHAAIVRYVYSLGPTSTYRGAAENRYDGRWEAPVVRTRAEAEAHLVAFPLGERINVYFDPKRPSRSSLARSTEWSIPRWVVAVALVIVCAAGILSRVVNLSGP